MKTNERHDKTRIGRCRIEQNLVFRLVLYGRYIHKFGDDDDDIVMVIDYYFLQ